MIIGGHNAPFKFRIYPIVLHDIYVVIMGKPEHTYSDVKAWLDSRFRFVEVKTGERLDGIVWYSTEDNSNAVALTLVNQNRLILYPDNKPQP